MSRIQFIEIVLILGVGLANVIEGIRLNMRGDLQLYDVLGPGRYLIVVGSALTISGIYYLITIIRKRGGIDEFIEIPRSMRIKMLFVIGALAVYTLLISISGYFLSTGVFFILIYQIFEVKPWYKNLTLSILSTMVLWVVFVYLLHMVFPSGILFD